MSFYTDAAGDVLDILNELGFSVSLRNVTVNNDNYDPTTGNVVPDETIVAAKAVVFDYPLRYIDGTKILHGDRQMFMEPTASPNVGDEVLLDSAWWKVVTVERLAPAGTPVLYTLQLRK